MQNGEHRKRVARSVENACNTIGYDVFVQCLSLAM